MYSQVESRNVINFSSVFSETKKRRIKEINKLLQNVKTIKNISTNQMLLFERRGNIIPMTGTKVESQNVIQDEILIFQERIIYFGSEHSSVLAKV